MCWKHDKMISYNLTSGSAVEAVKNLVSMEK